MAGITASSDTADSDPELTVLLAQSYSPYGEVIDSVGTFETSYGFTGEMTDGTGLINLRARWYSPTEGRFITKDSWSGDYKNPITLVKWVYANADPVFNVDPSGKKATDPDCDNFPTVPSTGKLSPKGENFIKSFELHSVWLYSDTGDLNGTCTIGYGTSLFYPDIINCSRKSVQKTHDLTVIDSQTKTPKELDLSKGLSEAAIEEYFYNEVLLDAEKINSTIVIPLSQNQFDALVSFLYNTGPNKLTNDLWLTKSWGKTNYANLINNHDFGTAFYEMIYQSSYIAKTKTFNRNLYFRRYEERELFFNNDYLVDRENDTEPGIFFDNKK